MIRLPIHKALPPSVLEGVSSWTPDNHCNKCSHSAGNGLSCMPHEGESDGLLVLDSYPSMADRRHKRHLSSPLGATLRDMAEKAWLGRVAYTTALRCPPKPSPVGEGAAALAPGLEECRPYLKRSLEVLKPRRIIALGAPAIYAITGCSITPSTMREGFAWVHLSHGWVPVFYGISPAIASRNKFLAAWLQQDFEKALTVEPRTPAPEPEHTWAELIITEADAERCLLQTEAAEWTAVDCEWAGRPYDKDFKLLSLSMTPKGSLNAFVWTQDALKNKACRSLLAEWLRCPYHKKVGSYFKSDTVALHAALGVWTRGVAFDTRLLRRLMDAEASGKLADMAHLVGRGGHKDELEEAMKAAVARYRRAASKGKGGLFKIPLPGLAEQSHADKIMAGAEVKSYGFAFVDPELLYRYNAGDTVVTALVGELLVEWLAKEPEGMQRIAKDVVIPAGDAYARVESWGLRVDKDALQNVGTYLDLHTKEIEERLAPYGYDPSNPDESEFNPGSPPKIGKLLFEKLKLKSEKKTDKGAAATDAEALEALQDQHPVVKDILAWRGLTKMRGTYVDAMLGFIRDDGRIHPSIHPDGARTGRTSSSNPNMQTTPSVESTDPMQAELARMYKSCFAPPHGYTLLELDYSQLELRVAADLSGDPEMLRIFKEGQDYHLRTAQMLSKTLWNIEPSEVTDIHRREVKACIAEGSLVLTNNGLKEIQAVGLDDLVWDGVEWVSHGGVVFQGIREVITYDGLTATPDHIIFTESGSEIRLSCAAQEGSRLAITAVGVNELRYTPVDRNAVCGQVPLVHRHCMHRLPSQENDQCGRDASRFNEELPMHDAPLGVEEGRVHPERSTGANALQAVLCDCSANYKSELHHVPALRGAWDSKQVQELSGVCGVLPRASAAPDLSGATDRPHQQRRELRAGELAACEGHAESEEHLAQSVLRVPRAEGDLLRSVASAQDGLSRVQSDEGSDLKVGVGWGACGEHSCQGATKAVEQKRVYDILNAGPRNRFTVSGKLVHNCNFALLYDDSPHGIAFRVGVSPEKAEQIRDAVFGCFPLLAKWIQSRVRETAATGHAWTWWDGFPARRRPLLGVSNLETSEGRTARRGSWNTPVQGTGNEYLVASAIQVVDWIVSNGIPAKLLVTIHDSMLLEVRDDCMSEVHDTVLEIMCSHRTKNGVPLVADAKAGKNWASMLKWKKGQPCPVEGCL